MFTLEIRLCLFTTFIACLLTMPLAGTSQTLPKGLGQALPADVLAGWDIDISPNGQGLPVGRGEAKRGAQLYAEKCQACHGTNGTGGSANKLTGGSGSLGSNSPLKSIGSFWPYATTLFDYIRRAMPLTAPQSLSADQVYALSAYLLFINGIINESYIIDNQNLAQVVMPNRQGFKPVLDVSPR